MSRLTDSVSLYPEVAQNGPPLRVGMMLDSFSTEAWVHRIIAQIHDLHFAELVAWIINWEPWQPKHTAWQNFRSGQLLKTGELFWRYTVLDHRLNPNTNSPFAPSDVRPLVAGAPIIDVTPLRHGFVHLFSDADVERIRELQLDVILRFGFNILKGEILDAARFGVWSYHHGDPTRYRGGPSMFWELHHGERMIGTVLQRLTETLDGGTILYRSHAAVDPTVWLSKVRCRPYWKATSFMPRALRRCYSTGALPRETPSNEAEPKGKIYRTPTNLQMLGFAARSVGRAVHGNVRHRLGRDQWFIAYRLHRPLGCASAGGTDVSGFTSIRPPKGENYADPFLFEHDGRTYCFFETSGCNGHGRIACLRLTADDRPSMAKVVLEADYHLSYPFVFAWQDKIYLMPETGSTRSLRVFEAVTFPHIWKLHNEVTFACPVYDPTLVERDGSWYLFAIGDECGGGPTDELFLFFGPTPLGPWQPHPMNPIVSDVRRARPAGCLFTEGDRLFRPAQDCSQAYGGAICLCEVTVLSHEAYDERVVDRIDPVWAPKLTACHTIAVGRDFDAIDGRRWVHR